MREELRWGGGRKRGVSDAELPERTLVVLYQLMNQLINM